MQDVSSSSLACGVPGYTSNTVIPVKAGDSIEGWYQHIIGGPQGANDPVRLSLCALIPLRGEREPR